MLCFGIIYLCKEIFMNNIYNYSLKELQDYFLNIGESKFRASQVFDWLYIKRVKSFDEMTNLKKDLITYLNNNFVMDRLKLIEVQKDIDVRKYLFELYDGNKIEAVLMNHDYGTSICVSSEIGCNMGCKFCESGRLKKVRNLETYEMVSQIITIQHIEKRRIDYVVVMGIGEPFDNYNNVLDFIDIVTNPKMLEIGSRHVTISTCGIVPKIIAF